MTTIKLGTISESEANQVMEMYQRKIALENLFLVLSERQAINDQDTATGTNIMYEKLLKDTADIQQKLGTWWQEISEKYGWEYDRTQTWEIKFLTKEVFLHRPS